jgi:hypothetical protein
VSTRALLSLSELEAGDYFRNHDLLHAHQCAYILYGVS